MLNATFDLLEFLHSNFTFLFSLIFYTILAIALAKSIKRNYKVYYWLFGVLSMAFVIPVIFRLCGSSLPFNLGMIPLFGPSISELSSAANFLHPVLVIIMFMGAFSPKIPYVGRLMSIRKELSIIVGFPMLAHTMKRLFGTFPGGWNYFFNHEEYMQNPRVVSALGSGIISFAFVLGVVMTVLFLVLWITSFDSVHRKLGTKKWKSIQKWSYGLYAMLFIHSFCILLGGIISTNAHEAQMASQPKSEIVQSAPNGHSDSPKKSMEQGHGDAPKKAAPQAAPSKGHGGKPKPFLLSEISMSRTCKSWINLVILCLVYVSYLVLRVRKSRADRARRSVGKAKA